jgi:hypothetical protein
MKPMGSPQRWLEPLEIVRRGEFEMAAIHTGLDTEYALADSTTADSFTLKLTGAPLDQD